MSMKWNVKDLILRGGVSEEEYQKIKFEISEGNRKTVNVCSLLGTLVMFGLFLVTFFVKDLRWNRVYYGSFMVPMILFFFLTRFQNKKRRSMILIISYLFLTLGMAIGIEIGTMAAPNEVTATFIALLLVAPQLFTDRPYRMYMLIVSGCVAFIVIAANVKDPVTWSSDFTNVVVFGLLSGALYTYAAWVRVSGYSMEETIRFMAENDQLTMLKNRNSYEKQIMKVVGQARKSVYCVYIDVNGLHTLNNTQGHEAGDRMLQFIAGEIREQFGKEITYRIGGDEFLVLGTDETEKTVEEKLQKVRDNVERAGYHIAVGCKHSSKSECDILMLVASAEEKMYMDKNLYYAAYGMER